MRLQAQPLHCKVAQLFAAMIGVCVCVVYQDYKLKAVQP